MCAQGLDGRNSRRADVRRQAMLWRRKVRSVCLAADRDVLRFSGVRGTRGQLFRSTDSDGLAAVAAVQQMQSL
jgi:hypothetical protein